MRSSQYMNVTRGLLSGFAVFLSSGCATLEEYVRVQNPQAEITGVRLDKLDLQQVGLLVDLKVKNPNAVGVNLSRLAYDFAVEGNSLLSGNQDQGVQVAANSEQPVTIPVTVNPANLWQTIAKVAKQDRFGFSIATTLTFALPVLGNVDLPLKYSGELPVLRIPEVKVGGLKIKELGLTKANLELTIQVANPNAFALLLNQFTYDFQVNQRSWINGQNGNPIQLDPKQGGEVKIPLTLNFLEMGTTVLQVLRAKDPVNYRFIGQFNFGSSESFLKSLPLPVDYSGKLQIFN